jgi:hypothetical protein
MFRKRKQPAPHFKLPPPYQPMSGEHAPLQITGVFPYCAMYQVAAEDTEVDYVLCRGFDVRINRFIDYAAGDANKPGIPVAKPFGNRKVGAYTIGQIFAAFLPLQSSNPSPTSVEWRVGQNPGVCETTEGHPADLYEKVDELYTTEGKAVNWMFVDSASSGLYWGMLMEDHPGQDTCFKIILGTWNPDTNGWDFNCSTPADEWLTAIDYSNGMPYPDQYAMGYFERRPSNTTASGWIYLVVELDCESRGACDDLIALGTCT